MVWRSDLILNGLEGRKIFAYETKAFSGCPASEASYMTGCYYILLVNLRQVRTWLSQPMHRCVGGVSGTR
jgi:hypothetical protein